MSRAAPRAQQALICGSETPPPVPLVVGVSSVASVVVCVDWVVVSVEVALGVDAVVGEVAMAAVVA